MIATVGKPKTSKPASLPEHVRIEIDGVAGTGKTHLLGTVGKGNKILILDLEGGTVTYSNPVFRDDPNATELENIEVVRFDDVVSATDLVFRLESTFDYLIRSKNADGYTLVGVDSMTEFQAKFMALHDAGDPRQSYKAMAEALHGIMLKVNVTPCHVVFTSRPKIVEDKITAREVIRSDLAPSSWNLMSGLLDAVGFYSVETQGVKSKWILDFSRGTRFQAKNRYGAIPKLVNPSMVSLLQEFAAQGASTDSVEPAKAVAPRRVPKPQQDKEAAA